MHGPFDGHERLPGLRGIVNVSEKAQSAVVEGHVSQMRTRIGEAHLDSVLLGDLLQYVGTVVGDRRAPAQRSSVLEHEVEEGVDGMHSSAVHTDLSEGLAHHGFVWASHDLRVEEVTGVPRHRLRPDLYPESREREVAE